MRKNRPLHTSQGSWKKTPLRRLSKGKMKIKTHLPSAGKGKRELGQRWQKVGKGEQRQANRSGGRRSKQTDTPESGGGQLYKKKADHLVCFLFAIIAHYEKRRKTSSCTSNWPTQQGAFANTPRCVGRHSTLCWRILHASFTENLRQKVCKNARLFTI